MEATDAPGASHYHIFMPCAYACEAERTVNFSSGLGATGPGLGSVARSSDELGGSYRAGNVHRKQTEMTFATNENGDGAAAPRVPALG
jgi:hypothetical protein